MMKSMISLQIRSLWAACKAMLLFTVFIAVIYTGTITLVGQLVFSRQANGSLLMGDDGTPVGSSLIGQSFTDEYGMPLGRYFQSRPSSTLGADSTHKPYNAQSSSASNLGPSNPVLAELIRQRKEAVAAVEGVDPSQVPVDAVTSSASGLDPHISPAYADIQVARVARERGLDVTTVRDLVARHTNSRTLGFMDEPTVNVVELNAALDRM